MAKPKKKLKTTIKLTLPAGGATAAPPVGSALGQHGVNIMDFVKSFNDKTKDQQGDIVPVIISVYEDRSFDYITKLPPVSSLIKKTLSLESGANNPSRQTVGTLSDEQLTQIAERKLPDLNATSVEAAKQIVAGTARSMGVKTA